MFKISFIKIAKNTWVNISVLKYLIVEKKIKKLSKNLFKEFRDTLLDGVTSVLGMTS